MDGKIYEVTVDMNSEMLIMKLNVISKHCKAMADELESLEKLDAEFDEDEEEKMTADYFETRRNNK